MFSHPESRISNLMITGLFNFPLQNYNYHNTKENKRKHEDQMFGTERGFIETNNPAPPPPLCARLGGNCRITTKPLRPPDKGGREGKLNNKARLARETVLH